MSGFSPRKGDRVESIRWPGHHGSVTGRAGRQVFVHWDGTSFSDEAALDELKPSRRAAPKQTSNQQLDNRRGL